MYFWVGEKSQAMYKDRFRNYKTGRIPWGEVGNTFLLLTEWATLKNSSNFRYQIKEKEHWERNTFPKLNRVAHCLLRWE